MERRGERGWVEVVCGPMFSGKSEELIRRVTRSRLARVPVQIFKPGLDTRFSLRQVTSHSSLSIEAHPVDSSAALCGPSTRKRSWWGSMKASSLTRN